MGDCKHCDHKIGQYTETFEMMDIFRCCHCGRKREKRREPSPQSGGDTYTYKPSEHGPHVPPATPKWFF